jgi:hypothetical protein
MNSVKGGCFCGAVRFAAPTPSLWVAHCHCSMCRRAHAAALVTWIGFREEVVELQDAEAQLRWHASSPGAERGFCGRCGSPMLFRSQRWPGELHIARALCESGVDREPQVHVFWDSHVSWLSVGDDGVGRMGDPKG